MKKIFTGMILVSLLIGCSNKQVSQSTSVEEEVEEKKTIWLLEPTLEFDRIKDIQSVTESFLHLTTSSFGEIVVPLEQEHQGNQYDVVIVEKDNKQGLYDYSGNERYPISINTVNTPSRKGITSGYIDGNLVYGAYDTATGKAKVFNNDFTETSEVENFQYDLLGTNTAKPYLAIQNGVIGVVGMLTNEAGQRTGWSFEAIDASVLENRTIITNVDGVCNAINQVIYDPNTGSIVELASGATYKETSFSNGYYTITSGNYASLIEVNSVTAVAVDYNNFLYMQDGYTPACKSNKWGFVDSRGYEVTDFIFDDLTPLKDGKTYASINGKFGILDITGLLDSGKQINMSTISDIDESDVIGNVTVNVNGLVMHETPEVNTLITGTCMNGSTYSVLEVQNDDTYSWYRINETTWIAGTDEWVTYSEN